MKAKDKIWRKFEQARKFVRSLGFNDTIEWYQYAKSEKRPSDIPSNANKAYKDRGWIGWPDFLGTDNTATFNRKFRSFDEAKEFLRPLGLKNITEYKKYAKSGSRPDDIPSNPRLHYKDRGWICWPDFLGTQEKKGRDKTGHFTTKIWLPFEQARAKVRSKGLKSFIEFKNYLRSEKPVGIPGDPDRVYENKGWVDYFDFIGFQRGRIWRPFLEARDYVRKQNIQKKEKYAKWDKRPEDIPAHPDREYKDEWKGWGDWLGTGVVASFNREYRSFEQARNFVHSLGIKNQNEWWKYCKSKKKPKGIPSNPAQVYKKDWKSWGDWFGTDFIATHNRKYLDFEPGREKARSLGLKSWKEWNQLVKSGKLPVDLPRDPYDHYKNKGWISNGDWLGTGTIAHTITGMSISKVKVIVRDMLENKVFDEMSDIERYHIFLAKGILNLQSHNRFSPLMKDLRLGLKTEKQRKALEDFVNSDSKLGEEQIIPELSSPDGELETATTEQLTDQLEKEDDVDPLGSEHLQSAKEILEQLSNPLLESVCEDEEILRFFIYNEVTKLWKNVFAESENGLLEKENGKIKTVDTMRQEQSIGKKFHDEVRNIFLSEYDTMLATTSKLPEGYSFRYKPSVMQRYVASKVYQLPNFGNFSDTGAGKTLSAILASRVIDSKVTLIVCPNDVVEQWSKVIVEVFPNSKVITGKPAFYWKHDGKASNTYLVINYDKFSQNNSKFLVAMLVKQKIDFIVLDEIHFIKKRDDSVESKRREVLGNLLTMARERNNEVKTLGMSATPVINNLEEGKSLLAYITNKVYDDLANRSTIFNAMALHEKLSLISIREIPRYKANIEYKEVNVVAVKPPHIRARDLKKHPLLIEQILTEARIPEIIKRIEGKTIIYTEYVTGIVKEILVDAVKNAGHTYIQYTGDTKDPLEKFIDPKQNIQVLVASSPISIGVDGLQEVCSNLIINTLPWTNAQFRQIIGRLHRTGQKHTVNVHIIKASISGYEYDEAKWTRIEIKRTLADCAVDGRIPIGLLQSKEQMYNELIMWLERLERNEISTFKRRDLNMQLTSIELEHAKRKISEFGLLNRQINKEYSQTTHGRIQQAPSILLDYHDKLDTAKTFWGFNPVNVIADKINLGLNIPKRIVMKLKIGDFGCGRAELADILKENKVYSFDHNNILNDKIIGCDIKDVSKYIEDGELDIAVFSLSLMGRNWRDYIAEANRCLESKGWLFIAETTNQLRQVVGEEEGRLSDLRNVIKETGFDIYNEMQIEHLTFLDARKH